MRIQFADYDDALGATTRIHDVPDDVVRRFLNWLMTGNRYRLENNPEDAVERLWKFRNELVAAARRAPRVESLDVPKADDAVADLLKMCDVTSVDELLEAVIASRQEKVAG